MEREYICPHCEGYLNVCDYIVFSTKNNKKQRGLIMLHPEIGNYTSLKHASYHYEPGENMEFYCPLCHKGLASDIDPNLIQVILIEDNKEYMVYFSRIAGEQSTYKVSGNQITTTGMNADRYTHFKLADEHKRFL